MFGQLIPEETAMQNWRNERDERDEGSGRERSRRGEGRDYEQTRSGRGEDDREGMRYSGRGERDWRRDERTREDRETRSERDEERRWEDETLQGRRDRESRGVRVQGEYELDRTARGRIGRESQEWERSGQQQYQPRYGWPEPRNSQYGQDYGGSYGERYGQYGGGTSASGQYGERYGSEYGQTRWGGAGATDSPGQGYVTEGRHEHEGLGRHMLQKIKEFIGKGPRNYVRSDERILEDISERLSQGYLDASDIEVVVAQGVVTLEGTVRNKYELRLAEDLIEHVMGVKDIENHMKVKRPRAGEESSAGDGGEKRNMQGAKQKH
jgi:osmotically-inducible protein OsmY